LLGLVWTQSLSKNRLWRPKNKNFQRRRPDCFSASQVWEFRDNRDVAGRLDPAGTHDGCFLPRSSHVTGNVLIHDMAYGRSPSSL